MIRVPNACDVAPPIPCRHAPRRLDDGFDGPEGAVDERGRLHGASELEGWKWIDRAVHPQAWRIAEQRKSG
jgi:hypothetical protein